MNKHVKKADMSANMVWAFIKPLVVIVGGVFMLVMLALLCMEIDMLKEYWMSERVYAASAERPDPTMEGCLVRVTGALCTDETIEAGAFGSFPAVVEMQMHTTTIAHADELRLGAWQVLNLYTRQQSPFCYFAINTPGVNWVEAGDTRLALLPFGAEVTLVGRQRGNALDMADPMAKAKLGKPAAGYLAHVNDSSSADISLRTFQGVAVFALLAYFGVWLLLGLAIRRSLWWGMVSGTVLLLVASIIVLILGQS